MHRLLCAPHHAGRGLGCWGSGRTSCRQVVRLPEGRPHPAAQLHVLAAQICFRRPRPGNRRRRPNQASQQRLRNGAKCTNVVCPRPLQRQPRPIPARGAASQERRHGLVDAHGPEELSHLVCGGLVVLSPPAPQKRISPGAGLWAACWLALCLVGICVLLALCLAGSLPGWPCWLALCRMVAASVPGWLCGCNAMFSDRPCARTSLCLPGSVPGWLCACSAMFSNWLCPSPCRAEPRSRPCARTRARLPMLPRKRCP